MTAEDELVDARAGDVDKVAARGLGVLEDALLVPPAVLRFSEADSDVSVDVGTADALAADGLACSTMPAGRGADPPSAAFVDGLSSEASVSDGAAPSTTVLTGEGDELLRTPDPVWPEAAALPVLPRPTE